MAPEMPSATYSFGATVCPELPTCRSIGSQPASQIGRDAASSAPSASASCCASGDVLLLLDAAPDRHDALGLRQIDRLLRFLERRLRLLPDRGRVDRHRRAPRTGAGDAPLRRLIGAKRADLERDEMRRRSLRHDVGGQLALEHRPHEGASRRRRA